MRITVVSLFVACVAALSGAVDARAAAAPSLRIVPGSSLTIAGAGFVPRTFVRLRLTGPGVDRLVRIRSGRLGSFVARFDLDKCSLTAVTASGIRGRSARVPTVWFVRVCPPPPPLDPAPTPY